MNIQIKWQNSIMGAYFWALVNFKENDYTRLLLIAKFIYNNTKNTNFCYILFQLNFNYRFLISYKKDVDFYSKSNLKDKLLAKLRKLMIVCRKKPLLRLKT